MRKLRSDDSPALTSQSLRFLAIRLRSRPSTTPLAKDVLTARATVRAAVDAWEEAREERMATTAEVQYRDAIVDRRVMDLSRDVSATVGGRQDDPRFRKLFPSAPSSALKPVGGEAQGRFILGVLHALKDDAAYKPFAARAKAIREGLDALDEAEDRRRDAFVAEARARAEVVAAVAVAQRSYNALYHQVALKFPDDDALVESFFLTSSVGSVDTATEDAPPAPAPADGAGETPVATAPAKPKKHKRTR
jgi:hypothetical protein